MNIPQYIAKFLDQRTIEKFLESSEFSFECKHSQQITIFSSSNVPKDKFRSRTLHCSLFSTINVMWNDSFAPPHFFFIIGLECVAIFFRNWQASEYHRVFPLTLKNHPCLNLHVTFAILHWNDGYRRLIGRFSIVKNSNSLSDQFGIARY
jgi:hypothetical protein